MSKVIKNNNFDKLKLRAHDQLGAEAYDENTLYQIELELQNQDLLAIQSEYAKAYDRYLNLFETAPTTYIIMNKSGLINEINIAGCLLLGFEKSNLVNRSFSRYVAPESQILFSVFKKHCFQNIATQTCEVKLVAHQGVPHVVQLIGKPQINHITNENELLIIATTVNEHNQGNWSTFYNGKVTDAKKRNSMPDLIATIAHELNNPPTVILNYVQGCIRRIENNNYEIEEIANALKIAASQSTRAADIILKMKEFKYYGTMKHEKVCLADLIKSSIEALKEEIMDFPTSVEFQLTTLPDVNIDRIHIEQVMSNLVRNAVDAMRDDNVPMPKLIIETNRISKNDVEVKILDNGPGVSPQILSHLFIPHFTTKQYGIGLGLSVSKSIIEAHGGTLVVEPNPVGGACFKFNIPII